MVKAVNILLLITLICTSCIREGEEECYTTALIYIDVVESNLQSPTYAYDPGHVQQATVYIFASDLQLERIVNLSRRELEERTPIEVTFRNEQPPKVVVWGNLNGSQQVTELVPAVSSITDGLVKMIKQGNYWLSPDELFYGMRNLTTEPVQQIPVTSWVGRIRVSVRGIEDVANNAGDYFFTISSKYDGYNFYGESQPGEVLLRIDATSGGSGGNSATRQEELLVHEPANLICYPQDVQQSQTIGVSVYKQTPAGPELIATADRDVDGNRIVTRHGENTNVLIDLRKGDINVYLKMTDWDYIEQWTLW